MSIFRGVAVLGTALFVGALGGPARADEGGVFQECCWRCRRAAVSCYELAPRCGPIRRLLGLCCPAPVVACRPCCPPPVVCAPPPCAPAVSSFAPVPAAPPVVQPAVPAPSSSYRQVLPPAPAPVPPVTGSSYRSQPALVPVPQAPPVRLDHLASTPGESGKQGVPASLATWSRTPTGR
jgi:hypothetical protein